MAKITKHSHDKMYDKIQKDAARGVYNQSQGTSAIKKIGPKPIPPTPRTPYPAGI